MPEEEPVVLEDVRIIFKNFAGKEGQYNREGDRNFACLLTDEWAKFLTDGGWNVKTTKERELDEGEMTGGEPYLPVTVSFKGRPPNVALISSRGRTNLGVDEVEMLDWADIRKVDLIVRPYDWTVNGKQGRKAYLKSIFVTINEDELDLKYSDVKLANAVHSFEKDEEQNK